MRQKSFILALCLLFLTGLLYAQTPVTIIQDADGINFFELYRGGLYFWKTTGTCKDPIINANIRNVSYLSGENPAIANIARSCSMLPYYTQNVVRDDTYFYFIDSGSIVRLPLSARDGAAFQQLPNPIAVSEPPGVLATEYIQSGFLGFWRIYWCEQYTLKNQTYIKSAYVNGSDVKTECAISGLVNIEQMDVYKYYDSSANPTLHRAVFYIDETHNLYRCDLVDGASITYLKDYVYAFKIQRTSEGVDRILCLRNYSPGKNKNTQTLGLPATYGEVYSVVPDSGASSLIASSNVTTYMTSLDTDPDFVYWSELSPSGTPDTITIKKKSLVDSSPVLTMYTGSGNSIENLRTDGEYFYYITNESSRNVIARLRTDLPPRQLDFQARYLEAIQTVQSINTGPYPEVALVAKKPTIVRGYASEVINTFGTQYRPGARLRGWMNNVEFPYQLNSAINPILTNEPMSVLRNDKDKSYIFQIPPSWLQEGTLRLQMTINPLGISPETGSATNVIERSFYVIEKGAPCMVFIPVRVAGLSNITNITYPWFWEIISRARTFLPIEDITVHYQSTDIAEYNFPWSYDGYEMPGDEDYIVFSLWCRDQTSSDPSGCSRTHWVGMLNAGTSTFNGQGIIGGDSMAVRLSTANETGFLPNAPYGGRTLAHEYGHNCGMGHVECGNNIDPPYEVTYPFDLCTIGPNDPLGYYGFDPQSWTVIPPTSLGDLMSYSTTRWTSSFTWDVLMNETPYKKDDADPLLKISLSEASAVRETSQLFVSGSYIEKTSEGNFGRFYLFPAGKAPIKKVAESYLEAKENKSKAASATIQLLDAQENVLSETPVSAKEVLGDNSERLFFAQYIQFIDSAKYIRLIIDSVQIAEKIISDNPPTINISKFEQDEAAEKIHINWDAYDPDGDPLTFIVQYDPGDGSGYQTLQNDMPLFGTILDTSTLKATNNGLIRVIAGDGVLSAIAISPSFKIKDHPPKGFIAGARNQQRFNYGNPIIFNGFVFDPDSGGSTPPAISWDINNGQQVITTTLGELRLDNPPPGPITVTMNAVDADSNPVTTTVRVEISPLVIPTITQPITIDGNCSEFGYEQGARVVRQFDDSSEFEVRLAYYFFGKLYVAFTGLKYKSGSSPYAMAGISIDKNASGDTWAQSDDVSFLVDENGNCYQGAGTGAGGMPTLTNPEPGFVAMINRGAETWSAELEIDESLFGGAEHAVRIWLAEYWLNYVGNDYGWPSSQWYDQPHTWAPAYIGINPPLPTNLPPVADAGADQNMISDGNIEIQLDASASYDPDGDPLTFSWIQDSGPGVTLSDSTAVNPIFQLPTITSPTQFDFTLTVNDGSLQSNPDTVSIIVSPQPATPVPTATPSPTPEETPTPTPTSTPEETPTPSPTPTETPDVTPTPTPTPEITPTPIETPTPTPISSITIQDVANYILGKRNFTPSEFDEADINNDGKVDIADIVYRLNK